MRSIIMKSIQAFREENDEYLPCEDGMHALSILEKKSIDLFIVDWNIPGISGLDLIKRIREKEEYKKTPVVMITSEASSKNKAIAQEAGVTSYIVKPVKGSELWNKISPIFDLYNNP